MPIKISHWGWDRAADSLKKLEANGPTSSKATQADDEANDNDNQMDEDGDWQLRRCQRVWMTVCRDFGLLPPLLFPLNLIRFNYIPFVNTYILRGRHSTIYIIDTVPWARIEYHNFMPKKRWNLTYSRLEKHYQQVELHPFVTLIINLRTGENEQQWPKTTVGWNAPK